MRTARKKKKLPAPQAKLDLHGYTIDNAYNQFIGFLNRSRDRELNLVEIVTGQSGQIRYEFPFWAENQNCRFTVAPHNGSFLVWI